MNKQMQLENDYYDALLPLIVLLTDDLTRTIDTKYATLDGVNKAYSAWYARYIDRVNNIGSKYTFKAIDLVNGALKQPDNYIYYKSLMQDVKIKTENMLNSIHGRYLNDLPIGLALVPVIGYVYDSIEELSVASEKSVRRFTTGVIANEVSSLVVKTAQDLGYTEYIGGNMQDDKVREQHRIDNDFKTWHKLDNPPPSGYCGFEVNCRCRFIEFR